MSCNLNQVTFAGRLGKDPEIKFLPNDNCVAQFSLAISRKYKGKDGQPVEETTWLDCEAWQKTAELISKYLTKGSACLVVGRMKQEEWEDKASGAKRSKLKVVVEQVHFLDSKPKEETAHDGPFVPVAMPPRIAKPALIPDIGGGINDNEPPFMRFEYFGA